MGDKILIYHDGQRVIIDSDLIYVPKFEKKSGTVSENEDKDENPKGNSDQN